MDFKPSNIISVTPYTFGLCLLAVGLTLSPFLMSIAQFWLLAVWLFDGVQLRQPFGKMMGEVWTNLKTKLKKFLHNPTALAVTSLYALHIIGLLWTSDFAYALKDLRVKLPLLVLPLIMSTMPVVSKKQATTLLGVYVAAVFTATLISFYKYHTSDYTDIRQISSFISHIRFSLNILLCMCILIYCLANEKTLWLRVVSLLLLCWFVVQIYIMQVMAAYMILFVLCVFTLFYALLKSRLSKTLKMVLSIFTAIIVIGITALVIRTFLPLFKVEKVDLASLPKKTALGNLYFHDTVYYGVEDGRYIGLYYCEKELRESWNERSEISFSDTLPNGSKVWMVLMRYMTSKNLTKDAVGIAQMSDEDVRNVESGIANYNNHIYPGIRSRISTLAFELNNYRISGDPNGKSLAQRIEYNKATFYLIEQHPFFGVGTGDIPNAYQKAYDDMNSVLDQEYRYRAHNQYLSLTVGFGVIGLLVFLFSMFFPFFKSKNRWNYLYLSFLLIILLSMLPEDTVETQAGATFFAFFSSLFLFTVPEDEFK